MSEPRYSPSLDAAPSSVSSMLVTISSSFASIVGCTYVIYRLYILDRLSWKCRHMLLCALACAYIVMCFTALVSGCIFLVYGRISSPAGCTLSGMIEFWSQQCADICILLTTLGTLSSVRHPHSWVRRQTWLQTGIVPMMGVIVCLPLIVSIVVQIVWRFHSSEFGYCWVPRMHVYARWVAFDAWRTLNILLVLATYIYITCIYFQTKHRPANDAQYLSQSMTNSAHRSQPVLIQVPRYSAIDSTAVSSPPSSNYFGAFSQSLGIAHRWALSKLGISKSSVTQARGLRTTTEDTAVGERPSYKIIDYYSIGMQHAAYLQQQQQQERSEIPTQLPRESIALTVPKTPRSYYEKFKRSLANTFIGRVMITTDIPSPTLSTNSIFRTIDSPTRQRPAQIVAPNSNTANNTIATSMPISSNPSLVASCQPTKDIDNRSMATVKRWYSALTRLLMKQGLSSSQCQEYKQQKLKRFHTIPPSSSVSPAARIVLPFNSPLQAMSDSDLPAAPDTPFMSRILETRIHAKQESFVDREPSIKARSGIKPVHIHNGIQYGGTSAVSDYSDDSAKIIDVEAIEHWESLEEGHWVVTTNRYRRDRAQPQVAMEKHPTTACISRMFVYPIIYLLMYMPHIVYNIMSTYVYYTVFQVGNRHVLHKRDVDLSDLPAHWTSNRNMHNAWPYYHHMSQGVAGADSLCWLAIFQAAHLLSGAFVALLFWFTEK